MKDSIKVKCPAKINLTLEIVNRRDDGFHNIKSIMHFVNLYDYLSIKISSNNKKEIILDGNSNEIPYDERNLVYKAVDLYFKTINSDKYRVEVYIEKNIPISAGLAGGSTDAAGALWGINQLLNKLDEEQLHSICSQLGSDLNVCLNGGCSLATSRGEVTKKIASLDYPVTLIKPKYLGISAGEAYKKYALKPIKYQNDMTEKMLDAIEKKSDIKEFLYNDLEYAVFDDYSELQEIKLAYPNSIMTGSGSTYFALENLKSSKLDEKFLFISNLRLIESGIEEII